MKQILLIALVALFVVSCQKDLQPSNNDYLETAKKALQDSLSATDFAALDFSKATRSSVDSTSFYALRIPFKGKVSQEDFVFIKTNEKGKIEKGKIIHLQGKVTEDDSNPLKRKRWDGSVSITSLDRKAAIESPIVDGYITGFHRQNSYRTASQEPQGEMMPEVIITYVRTADYGYSWSNMFMLQALLADGGGGGGGYYGPLSGGSGGGDPYNGGGGYGGGGGGSTGGGSSNDPVVLIDKESQDVNPAIDVQKYVKCFSNIPDAGSTCYIEISSDIPVDNNPNAFFDFSTMSPGHTFITISKSNGTQHVTQNIGFYPKSGYKSMTYAPTAGKLVDNAKHEFNASLYMSLTPAQLSTVLLRIQQLSNLNYDIDQYNCTDWALDIFNSVRTNKLEIPLYGLPDSPMTQSTRTPQGLYNKLQQMVNNNDPEKKNITIDIIKGYAGGSNGPCN
ncbi:hypothetical protein [Flavisolibacter nicotianae]|uniref:hypothetical protein n=1 Tax=Flavisolibacter nicotianae TaxID=2364882 RepID=UPI00196909CC|nr:hypothetical protein [Flavisolibacter nicotianae]